MKSTATHRSTFSACRISQRDSPFLLEASCIREKSSVGSLCSLEPLLTSIEYKNGAIYRGTVSHSRLRSGSGDFRWKSGLQYVGQFRDERREGEGELVWPDGSRYKGEFHKDVREGKGKHFWKDSGEIYVGEYHNDKRHGNGKYSWPSGAMFRGTFRDDLKEGPGIFESPQGEIFEGMYHSDIRDGEGVMTYPGGIQDEGIWKGSKLMQMTFPITDIYFDSFLLDMSHVSARCKRRKPRGYLEVASQEFIQQAGDNNLEKVKAVLERGLVHVDVTDIKKCSALLAAAINGHCEVVDYLLDNGANVNQLEINGMSVLNACHHVLYSSHTEVKLLLKQCLTSQQSSSGVSHFGGETSVLFTSNFRSTPYIDVSDNSGENKNNSGHSKVNQGIEVERDRLIYPSPRLCYQDQDNFHVGRSLLVAVGVDKTHPQLHETQSFSSLMSDQGYQDKRVRFRSRTTNMDKFVVTGMKSTVKEVADKRNRKFGKILEVSAIDTSIANVNYNSDAHDDNRGKKLNGGIIKDSCIGYKLQSMGDSSQLEALGKLNLKTSEVLSSKWMMSGDTDTPITVSEVATMSPILSSKWTMSGDTDTPITVSEVATMSPIPRPASTSINQDTPLPSSTTPRPVSAPINQDTPLHSLKKQRPRLYLGLDELPGPRVLSSSKFGSTVSADQSTTISCTISEHSSVPIRRSAFSSKFGAAFSKSSSSSSRSSASSSMTTVTSGDPLKSDETVREMIQLLLSRGADSNIGSYPFHPLVYSVLAGDIAMSRRLLQSRDCVDYILPDKLGGYTLLHLATKKMTANTPELVKILLEHGANPNSNLGIGKKLTGDSRTHTAQETGVDSTDNTLIGGENEGTGTLTPLHFICAVNITETGEERNALKQLIPLVIGLLVTHGGAVNCVSNGHSPLSLAIFGGFDNAVEALLENGADPNIPLGLGVANAMCALTTHTAHKARLPPNSSTILLPCLFISFPLLMFHKLMLCGASILSPVRLSNGNIGLVTDFAHAAFKEDKRLSLLKFSYLSKSERIRYRSIKKLQKYLVNILRCKALHLLASDDEFWQHLGVQGHMDAQNDIITRLHTSHNICSLLALERRTTVMSLRSVASLVLPEITLTDALNNVIRVINKESVEGEGEVTEQNRAEEKSKKKEKMNKIVRYKKLIQKATTVFMNYKQVSVIQESTWGFSSFCYECGRSSGVRLQVCLGCKMVSYCSRSCKGESWKKGHREECSKAEVIKLKMSPYNQEKRSPKSKRGRRLL